MKCVLTFCLQEAMHCAGGDVPEEALGTGAYVGCMYTEYLDAILGPSVSVAA